ncbi:nucleoside hydrolase [Mucilaginibacter sp. OK268]|uniref:nucleoside hydrolase n=2 Tax=Mucilaginibacter TaxID=423349 RepID=UPI000B83B13E|nr:nucleoside hydrolase [Mucilaginibacter sp. OK268]
MRIFQTIFFLLIFVSPLIANCQMAPLITPRMRVIIDNDFGGDPDGLFQLTHLLLSPSVEIRAIIGTHLNARDGFDPSKTQADNAAKKAHELLSVMKMDGKIPLIAGSNTGMPNDSTPVKSDAVDFILKEALRTDTKLPLYVLCGAGLTEIASAALTKPEIAEKLTLIWIGGAEYSGLALPPPNGSAVEYNLNIDIFAARALFNRSQVNLWQVPRNVYRQALISYAELATRIKPNGEIGKYLFNTLENLIGRLQKYKFNIGETYVLGDSPLVLLTALQSSFEADPSSSDYMNNPCPIITSSGVYQSNPSGRKIRVYQHIDTRLMFGDFFSKLELFKN